MSNCRHRKGRAVSAVLGGIDFLLVLTRCSLLQQLEEASDGRLKVLYGDALTVAHEEVLPKFTNPDLAKQGRIHYIGNLPFAVARGITISLLQQISKREGFFAPGFQTQMSFMFQKEVGKLICAPPGVYERKRLSVLVQSLCDAHSVYDVPASVFVPRPQVDAAVVHFKPLQDPFLKDVSFDTLSLVLRYGFDRPSRMLKQGLADLTKEICRSNPAVYGNMSTRDLVLKLLKHADVPPFRRARAASIEEWVRVAKATDELMKKY